MTAGLFARDQLPGPIEYFEHAGIALRGRGLWRDAVCPFHDDTRPSLRVRIDTGAYRCMVCGEHGGGVLDFHMARHGLRFVEAAQSLGAWRSA